MSTSDYSHVARTRIKICGITQTADLLQAALLGVDAVGFVFYPPSKRHVTPVQAAGLLAQAPAFVNSVALFVNPDDQDVESVLDIVSPSVLQFHGDETPEQCLSYATPYIKAFRVGAPGLDTPDGLAQACLNHPHAAGWLFDSYTPAFGGSGARFDYSLLTGVQQLGQQTRPLILSGGLTADNIGQSMHAFIPWAVDISSGVEDAPGQKSIKKMADFVAAVRIADSQLRKLPAVAG
jgi:phosphoribosylanthranilate isomerase